MDPDGDAQWLLVNSQVFGDKFLETYGCSIIEVLTRHLQMLNDSSQLLTSTQTLSVCLDAVRYLLMLCGC